MKTGKKVLFVSWNAVINAYEIFEEINDLGDYICRRFYTIEQLEAFQRERNDAILYISDLIYPID